MKTFLILKKNPVTFTLHFVPEFTQNIKIRPKTAEKLFSLSFEPFLDFLIGVRKYLNGLNLITMSNCFGFFSISYFDVMKKVDHAWWRHIQRTQLSANLCKGRIQIRETDINQHYKSCTTLNSQIINIKIKLPRKKKYRNTFVAGMKSI